MCQVFDCEISLRFGLELSLGPIRAILTHNMNRNSFILLAFLGASIFTFGGSSYGAEKPKTNRKPAFTEANAVEFARLSLRCTQQEFPNAPAYFLDSIERLVRPSQAHPAFHGCLDWHSAVHGHWALVRLLKTFPSISVRDEMERVLDADLKPELIEKEVAYFKNPTGVIFERPYGYAWLLRLALELRTLQHPKAAAWLAAISPLEQEIVGRAKTYLEKFDVPTRAGFHPNTAFAITHFYDYARVAHDTEFLRVIQKSARKLYMNDRNCPLAYEPSGGDFLSPCLTEADLMRRILSHEEFLSWFKTFLPKLDDEAGRRFLAPAIPSDPNDPIVNHLVGLSLSKASQMQDLVPLLQDGDERKGLLERSIAYHIENANRYLFNGTYDAGLHWLASFAIFYYTDAGGGEGASLASRKH